MNCEKCGKDLGMEMPILVGEKVYCKECAIGPIQKLFQDMESIEKQRMDRYLRKPDAIHKE